MRLIPADLLAVATPAEQAAYERALVAEVALSSPADYAAHVSGGRFQRPPHVELLSRTLTALVERRLLKPDGTPYLRLAVSMPPRHGKSELCSKYFPAWYLTRWPEGKVIVAGYEADFARDWGRMARDVLQAAPPGLAPELNRSTTAADNWRTVAGGGMGTAGVGGPITGKGATILLVDDPVKNFEDAQSETKRNTAHNWALSTAFSRLEPMQLPDGSWSEPGIGVVIMTRWHGDDLLGRLLQDEPDDWYVLCLPALAGTDDPLGRVPGEALWPERFSAAQLEATRKSVGPQIFASLYQQSPFVEGGGIFRGEKARFYTRHKSATSDVIALPEAEGPPQVVPVSKLSTFGVVDLAASTRTSADYSVYSLWGITPPAPRGELAQEDTRRLVLLDAYRARIEGADHMAVLERLHKAWRPSFWGIEKATFGLSLIQTATRTGRIPVRELKPDWDKVSRAFGAAALMEAGRLWFPRHAPWVDDWIAELLAFDKGRHDDMVDCTAYAAKVLNDRLHGTRPGRSKEPESHEERIWAQLRKEKRRDKDHPLLGGAGSSDAMMTTEPRPSARRTHDRPKGS
jgi:predicted phage terminase large subunit-like protein